MWWIILLINNFQVFPSKLRRLIGPYLVTYLLLFVPGFVIVMTFAFFHISGKNPFFKLPLYNAVMVFGNILNVSFLYRAPLRAETIDKKS